MYKILKDYDENSLSLSLDFIYFYFFLLNINGLMADDSQRRMFIAWLSISMYFVDWNIYWVEQKNSLLEIKRHFFLFLLSYHKIFSNVWAHIYVRNLNAMIIWTICTQKKMYKNDEENNIDILLLFTNTQAWMKMRTRNFHEKVVVPSFLLCLIRWRSFGYCEMKYFIRS